MTDTGAGPAGRGPVRGGLLHLRPQHLLRRLPPAGSAPCWTRSPTDHRGVGAARRGAGLLLREPGRRDRCHAAPPARPDLRVPVRDAAHPGDAGRGRAGTPSRTGGGNLYADVLAAERAAGDRVVAENEHWTAYVPAAARWPFEVHVAPHREVPDIPALSDAERDAFGPLYLDVLRRFDGLFDMPMPYISAWHQAAVRRGPRAGLPAPAAVQHPAGRGQAEVPGRLRVRDGRLHQRHRPGDAPPTCCATLTSTAPVRSSRGDRARLVRTRLTPATLRGAGPASPGTDRPSRRATGRHGCARWPAARCREAAIGARDRGRPDRRPCPQWTRPASVLRVNEVNLPGTR